MKIKMFSKILAAKLSFTMALKEPLHAEIEKEINDWLIKMPDIKIHHIKQSMSGGSWAPCKIVVSIFYE
jgi:hypothetical protein